MDQVFAEAKIEITPTSKLWEPERAYEKRLTTIMGKDNGKLFVIFFVSLFSPCLLAQVPKVKKPRKSGKSEAAAASSAEESEGERTLDEAEAAPRPRPKPRRVTRANPVIEEATIDEGNEPGPVTPKARPRPRPIHQNKTPTGSLLGSDNGQKSRSGSPLPSFTPSDGEGEQGGPNNEVVTPQSSLKRPRADDEVLDAPNGTSDSDDLVDVNGTPDMQIRRKRIRH